MLRSSRRPTADTGGVPCVDLVFGVLGFVAAACCPPSTRALPPYEDLTASLDASTVRTYGATVSLSSRAPASDVPVLLVGESLAIHVELPPASHDVLVAVTLRGPNERAMLWSSGVPREHDVRLAHAGYRRLSDSLELDVGVFVPELELEPSQSAYCAAVELDVVRGDVMRRRVASGTTQLPTDAELSAMTPGDWTRVAVPVLVATLETATGAIDDTQWKLLAAQGERCGADAAATG